MFDNEQNDWSEFVNSLEESRECPICLETHNLKSNNLIKSCSHHYCKVCYKKINECALCKKKFVRSNESTQPTQRIIYVDTIGGTMSRHINITGTPPNPTVIVSPWNNSSIEPDF
jgi:hypothetical protein